MKTSSAARKQIEWELSRRVPGTYLAIEKDKWIYLRYRRSLKFKEDNIFIDNIVVVDRNIYEEVRSKLLDESGFLRKDGLRNCALVLKNERN